MKLCHSSYRILVAVLALSAVLASGPAFAQGTYPGTTLTQPLVSAPALFGSDEFRVNTTDLTKQRESTAAFAPDGSSVIAWRDLRGGIMARFFPLVGEPSEDVTLVENQIFDNNPGEGTIFSRRAPKIVFLPSGDFLLLWTEEKAYLRAAVFIEDYTTLDQDVYAQRFSPTGEPADRRFRVHRRGRGLQRSVSVAAAADGSLLVAWEQSDGEPGVSATDGVYARRFSAKGIAIGRDVKIDEVPGLSAHAPRISYAGDGFLAVWEGEGDGADGFDAYARLLDADGQPVGPQMRINSTLAGDQRRPQPATGADGQHLVVWYGPTEEDPLIHRVYGQMISSDGALLGPELRVGDNEQDRAHALPRVAVSPGGEFLVAWLTWFGDFQTAVDGVHLDALGNPAGEAFRISEHQTSSRSIEAVASPNGDFLVTWEGFTDGNLGISARNVAGSQPQLILAVPGQISAATPSSGG